MRTFCISLPPEKTPANVLVFLHGVGEAFIPVDGAEGNILYSAHPGDLVKRPGLKNLFNYGVPRILSKPGKVVSHDPKAAAGSAPFSHPLFKDFVTIIPQAFLRQDMADEARNQKMMEQICAIATSVIGQEPKIAVMGFSRGGFAALQVATRPEVKAIVTMDAVGLAPAQALEHLAKHKKPVWAFYADYPETDKSWKEGITDPHRKLEGVAEINDFTSVPDHDRCKTLVPTYGSKSDRHTQVADLVSQSPAVYEWLLSRLQAG